MKTIAVVGDPVLDQVYQAADPVVSGGKMLGTFVGVAPGGTTANFACAAARFGLRPRMFGQVADTWEGDVHRKALEAFGVDTQGLIDRDVERGAHTVIIIGPDGEKTLIYVPFPQDGSIEPNALLNHDLIYVMAADFNRITTHLTNSTVEICVDVDAAAGLDYEAFRQVAKHTDVLFINDIGFRKLVGRAPDLSIIEALLGEGPSLVCCTGGAGMSYAVERDGQGRVSGLQRAAVPARVVDTTGAGDCFNAAFLARRARGESLADCMDFAMAAGALATEGIGARESLPETAIVLDRMSAHRTASEL